MSNKKKIELIESGRQAVREYFEASNKMENNNNNNQESIKSNQEALNV